MVQEKLWRWKRTRNESRTEHGVWSKYPQIFRGSERSLSSERLLLRGQGPFSKEKAAGSLIPWKLQNSVSWWAETGVVLSSLPLARMARPPPSLLYGCFLQEASHSWGQERQSQDCSYNFAHSHPSGGWFQESLEIALQGCPSPWSKMNTVAPPYLRVWKFINWRRGRGTVVRGNGIFHKNPKMQWRYFLQHYPRARFWSTWKRKGPQFGWLRLCLSHISVILPFGDMEVFRVILYLQYKSDFPY